MIKLYTDTTPNGYRASVILQECGLPHELIHVNTEKGEHKREEFLALNPAGAIPVMVDEDGPDGQPLRLPQSGAILIYAAEKSGLFIPQDGARRAQAWRWFYQVGTDITSASSWIFNSRAMPMKHADNDRWLQDRLAGTLSVADRWLGEHAYFADEVSIADFLLYPNFWFRRTALEASGKYPNLCRWGEAMSARPALQRGMAMFTQAP